MPRTPDDVRRVVADYERRLDQIIADLQAAGLPPAAIDLARAHFAYGRAEIRAAAGMPLPGEFSQLAAVSSSAYPRRRDQS